MAFARVEVEWGPDSGIGSSRLLIFQELMKEFEVKKLVTSIRCVIGTSHFVRDLKAEGVSSRKTGTLALCKRQVLELSEHCKAADLRMSVLALDRTLVLFNTSLSEGAIAESLADAIKRAVITVEDELSLRVYLSLEPSEAELYEHPLAGWDKITQKFPDVTRDIEEMNKCFALGRYTASMFHAMHVAEWGAIELGKFIGVTDPKKGWGPTQKELEALIKAGHSKLPAKLSGKFEFLEQMGREIHTMVLAWRHKVDHAANHLAIVPNTDFTPEIARHIIGSVKVFMSRLEEGLK